MPEPDPEPPASEGHGPHEEADGWSGEGGGGGGGGDAGEGGGGLTGVVAGRQALRLLPTLTDAPLVSTTRDMEHMEHQMQHFIALLTKKVATMQSSVDFVISSVVHDKKARATHILRDWRTRHQARAFTGWREHMATQLRRAQVAIGRRLERTRVRVYEAWREQAAEHAHALRHAGYRFGHGLLLKVFEALVGYTRLVAAARRKGKGPRALTRVSHGMVGRIFFAWADAHAAERAVRARELAKFGSRLHKRISHAVFGAWARQTQESAEHKRGRLGASTTHFRHALLLKCLVGWLDFVAQRRAVLARARRALGPGRELWRAFSHWSDDTRDAARQAERREAAQLVVAVVSDMLRRSGVDQMRDELTHLKDELSRERGARESAEASARDERVKRLLRGWYHKHTTPAFAAWLVLTRESKQKLAAAVHLCHTALAARVVRGWHGVVHGDKAAVVAVVAAARRTLGRGTFSRAFCGWRDCVRRPSWSASGWAGSPSADSSTGCARSLSKRGAASFPDARPCYAARDTHSVPAGWHRSGFGSGATPSTQRRKRRRSSGPSDGSRRSSTRRSAIYSLPSSRATRRSSPRSPPNSTRLRWARKSKGSPGCEPYTRGRRSARDQRLTRYIYICRVELWRHVLVVEVAQVDQCFGLGWWCVR